MLPCGTRIFCMVYYCCRTCFLGWTWYVLYTKRVRSAVPFLSAEVFFAWQGFSNTQNTHPFISIDHLRSTKPYYTNASDVPRSLQSWASTIQTVVLTADVFQLKKKNYFEVLCIIELHPAGYPPAPNGYQVPAKNRSHYPTRVTGTRRELPGTREGITRYQVFVNGYHGTWYTRGDCTY